MSVPQCASGDVTRCDACRTLQCCVLQCCVLPSHWWRGHSASPTARCSGAGLCGLRVMLGGLWCMSRMASRQGWPQDKDGLKTRIAGLATSWQGWPMAGLTTEASRAGERPTNIHALLYAMLH